MELDQSTISVFRNVFADLGFPYLSADLARMRAALLADEPPESSWLAVPLDGVSSERRGALVAALLGFLGTVDPSLEVGVALVRSATLSDPAVEQALATYVEGKVPFSIREESDRVVWEERSLWPLAYGVLLWQLGTLLHVQRVAIEERRAELPFGSVLSEFPRLLPTRFHYAFASLGAWLGGATNVQFFGLYATEPQIRERGRNVVYGMQVGYDVGDATKLDASGFVAVPPQLLAPLMMAQGDLTVFGSIAIGELNVANPPRDLRAAVAMSDASLDGLLVDKYYRAPFIARPLDDVALYGARTVLRDHYADFYQEVEPASLLRCKHYCAPVIEVGDTAEIDALVARIPLRSESGLHFRGQARLYTLARDPAVRRMLFGDSCDLEPSLTTSAARQSFSYEELHFTLRHYLGDQVFARASAGGDMSLVEEWQSACAAGDCRLDYALMALAQHYGLPSHGLDVTTDLGVAVWFATNALTVEPSGRARYRSLAAADWPEREADWPVVFVHQAVTHSVSASLQDCVELEEFGFLAQRPRRQHARFFHGGHSDHQNRLAETLVCVLRLRPGDYRTRHELSELFPSPADDEAYRVLLDFAERHPPIRERVLRFH